MTYYVWYIQGEVEDGWPTLFANKIDAEAYARRLFPNEDEDKRHARIFCREVFGG